MEDVSGSAGVDMHFVLMSIFFCLGGNLLGVSIQQWGDCEWEGLELWKIKNTFAPEAVGKATPHGVRPGRG